MRNCIEIIQDCLQLYKNFIIGNLLQNFSDQYCNKLCIMGGITSFNWEKIWP